MKTILIVILLISSIFSTDIPNYYEPLQPDYYQQFDDIRIQVIAHGLPAPSAHNTQPWIVKLINTLEQQDQSGHLSFNLYVDSERLLPDTDPLARHITISRGTFLETVKIGAKHLGYDFALDLFPDGKYGDVEFEKMMKSLPVAHIRLTNEYSDNSDNHKNGKIYKEIFNRVTNRTTYNGKTVTDEEMAVLQSLVDDSDISIVFLKDRASLEKIRQVAICGVKVESTLEPKK